MSDLRKTVMAGRSATSYSRQGCADYRPLKWSDYFDKHDTVKLNNDTFHYYTRGSSGPVLVTLHGGGYSALTWGLFAKDITSKIDSRILAIDLRGHGSTVTEKDDDLSIEQLAKDIYDVISAIYMSEIPPIILIGHSMGGAIAVEAGPLFQTLVGVCIIDVVEGAALESLSAMQNILRGRPSTFLSIEHAIQWGFHGGTTRNLEAARLSMPGQIKNKNTGKLASEEVEENDETSPIHKIAPFKKEVFNCIDEEEAIVHQTDRDKPPLSAKAALTRPTMYNVNKINPPAEIGAYTWRIDLSKTETFWSGWFKGLSQKFLNVHAPKILLLANIHGLDTSLTVGQMQGKFQLQVLPRSGHAIHEDQPETVADIIGTYLIRQKLANASAGFIPLVPGC